MARDGFKSSAEREEEKKQKQQQEREKEANPFLQRFNEQSCLMLNLDTIVSQNYSRYSQFAPIMSDTAYSFINELFHRQKKNYGRLLELNSAQLSALVPKIKIYKQYVDLSSKKTYDIEFVFDNHLTEKSIQSMISTRKGRGDGAGIKSFSWQSDGKTVAETSLFRANLQLYFQSINDLFVVRDTMSNPIKSATKQDTPESKTLNIKFVDLIVSQPIFRKTASEGSRVYNPDYFRIKINVGWQILKNKEIFDDETIRVLESLNETFFLTIYSHDLKFDEQGGVTLSIDYRTYAEAIISDPSRSNIFKNIEEIKKLEELKSQKQQSNVNDTEYKKKQIEDIDNEISSKKTKIYEKFLKSIIEENKIKSFDVDLKAYNKLFSIFVDDNGNKSTYGQALKVAQALKETKSANEKTQSSDVSAEEKKTLSEDVNKKLQQPKSPEESMSAQQSSNIKKTPQGKEKYRIRYFHLGDLMEVVLRDLHNPEDQPSSGFMQKELRTILGPITFIDYGTLEDSGNAFILKGQKQNNLITYFTGKRTTVNIADIPISLSLYNNWFLKEIVEPGYVNFTLKQFLEAIINNLVISAIGQETNLPIPTQKINLSYKPVSVAKNKKREDIFSQMSVIVAGKRYFRSSEFKDVPLLTDLKDAGSGEKEPIENYLIIYGSSEKTWRKRKNQKDDEDSSIYTMTYGASTGLVKKIIFEKVDMPEYNASLMHKAYVEQQGESTLLRGIYKASVEMFGNTLYELGSSVYIHPYFPGFSNDIAISEKQVSDLGIGGYYTVIKVDHNIDLSSYTTKLELLWNSKGFGKINIGKYEVDRVYKRSDLEKAGMAPTVLSSGDYSSVEAIIVDPE